MSGRLSVTTTASASDAPLFTTVTVYVMRDEGLYVFAFDVLAIARSARVWTFVNAVALLFPLFGSATSLVTTALLTRMVASGVLDFTLATIVIDALPPLGNVPRLPGGGGAGSPGIPPMHDPTLGVKLTSLTAPGSVSFTRTLGADEGPALLTVMV